MTETTHRRGGTPIDMVVYRNGTALAGAELLGLGEGVSPESTVVVRYEPG